MFTAAGFNPEKDVRLEVNNHKLFSASTVPIFLSIPAVICRNHIFEFKFFSSSVATFVLFTVINLFD